MSKRTPPDEWYVAESDAEWQRLCAPPPLDTSPDLASAVHRPLSAQRLLGGVAILVCLLAGAWWWHTAQVTLSTNVTATAQPKQRTVVSGRGPWVANNIDHPSTSKPRQQDKRVRSGLTTAYATTESIAYGFDAVQTFEVQGDWALARVVMYTEHGEPAYRQTRFYQRIGSDWRQTPPDAALWGPARNLETPTFVYHFRQRDAPVVIAVAPQIEALYTTLRRNLGLSLGPGAEKLVIEVSVTQAPGYVTPWIGAAERIVVPSPAVYLAPVELSDEELLVQSIALPLLAGLVAQASEYYTVGSDWRPLMNGLYLWQVWDLDLPLAAWHEEVVTWVYADLSNSRPGQAVVLPEHYTALCAAHQLWMPSPAQINIPLLCAEIDWEDLYLSPWGWYDPLTHLDQLGVPLPPGEYIEGSASLSLLPHPGRTVALVTLIEYAVATYGQERLPALVAGLGQYHTWDALLLAVYGVSAAEFEAGWQGYLATHYGV